ncbi:SufE family protein [Alkalinema pantanalense CENA528]|uniref:SufE family protein n=1 Tax=Alkalinema pantanalense TaxID=1620705 RepID=UPI003D6F166E
MSLVPQPLLASLERIVQRFQQISEPKRRYKYLLCFAKRLPPFSDEQKVAAHRVPGCVSQVYVTASLEQGKMIFQGDSDSHLTKGLLGLLVEGLNGLAPAEIIQLKPNFIQPTGSDVSLTPSRVNGFYNIFQIVQQKALVYHLVTTYLPT